MEMDDAVKGVCHWIVEHDYEFVSVIERSSGLMRIIEGQSAKKVPYLLGDGLTYQAQFEYFLSNSVSRTSVSDARSKMELKRVIHEISGGKVYSVQYPVILKDGKLRYKKWRFAYLSDDEDYILFTRVDVTDSVLSENDAITGLATKERAFVKVRKYFETDPEREYIMLRLDIDNFRIYNQLFGYNKGDELLSFMGKLLAKIGYPILVVGHFNADRFVLLADKNDFKESLFDDFYKNLQSYNTNFIFSVSIGITPVTDKTQSLLLYSEEAFLAAQTVKNLNGLSFAYYNSSLKDELIKDHEMIGKFSQALINKEFVVYYQPIVDQKKREVAMCEALVRWNSPYYGFVPPDKFIGIFEKTGQISELDSFVREEVLKFLSKRIQEGKRVFPISVNISRYDIEEATFVKKLVEQVDRYKIPHKLLKLEITESIYVESEQRMISIINELKEMDFYIEMDDFGSGYSSLSVLRNVPFDLIKLDMKFFSGGEGDKKTNAVVQASVNFASAVGLDVIAEGVEKKNQADFLLSLGVKYIQGYYFSKPLDESNFLKFIETFK